MSALKRKATATSGNGGRKVVTIASSDHSDDEAGSIGLAPPAAQPDGIPNLLEAAKPFKNPNYKSTKKYKSFKQVLTMEKATTYPIDFPTYWSMEAPPSILPQPKYCDITGFEAPYTDPKTNLRYHNMEVYQHIQQLPRGTEQQYLELRNAHVVLK